MRKLLASIFVLSTLSSVTVLAPEAWQPPHCRLTTRHFLVNSAVLYVKGATESRFADRREAQLSDAQRVLNQAINRGQSENPAVWYYYGRYYEMKNDPSGADSAYGRAAELEPECAEDIMSRRRAMWVPIVNRAIEAFQANEADSAAANFRLANTIYDQEPQGFYYLADLLSRQFDQPDSAIYYFKKALTLTNETDQHESIRANSTYMVAQLYHVEQELDSAAVWYEKYREIEPADSEVISGLADVYSALGNEESALALYDSVVANADQFEAKDIFTAGVSMFLAEQFDRAARAFERGLAMNPYHRDGLYNLANTYLALALEIDESVGEEAKRQRREELGNLMLPVALRLNTMDSNNQQSIRLLAQAYQLIEERDSTLALLEKANATKFDIVVDRFYESEGDTHTFQARIVNLMPESVSVPGITFEFIDTEGNVVTTERLEPATLEVDGTSDFQFNPAGEAIQGWRYTVEAS